MDAFEYIIVENLLLTVEDEQKFCESIRNYLNEGWEFAGSLHITRTNLSRTYTQPLVRRTHVKNEN